MRYIALIVTIAISGCTPITSTAWLQVSAGPGMEQPAALVVDALRPVEQTVGRAMGRGREAYETRTFCGEVTSKAPRSCGEPGNALTYNWERYTRY